MLVRCPGNYSTGWSAGVSMGLLGFLLSCLLASFFEWQLFGATMS
jgi:hypothetical protein